MPGDNIPESMGEDFSESVGEDISEQAGAIISESVGDFPRNQQPSWEVCIRERVKGSPPLGALLRPVMKLKQTSPLGRSYAR